MSKLPSFQFYPGDWVQDTAFLSLASKGGWMDCLCALWRAQTRGKLTLSIVAWARIMRATADQAKTVIDELVQTHTCDSVTDCNGNVTLDGNGNVTLVCRQMVKEETKRENLRKRVKNYRMKRSCNTDVSPDVTLKEEKEVYPLSSPLASPLLSPDQEKEEKPPISPLQGENVCKIGDLPENQTANGASQGDSPEKIPKNGQYTQWFETVWLLYPAGARVGKKLAFKHFQVSVKTENDFEALKQSLAKYLDSKRVSNGYVQNGSTWFNNWRDWLNYTETQTTSQKIAADEEKNAKRDPVTGEILRDRVTGEIIRKYEHFI